MPHASVTGATRLLAIGLDALSPELLAKWTADGTLPNLRALTDRSLNGPVRGIEGFFVGSTWPSFYTGLNPANHGMHYELQIVPGTYDLQRIQHTPEYVRGETLWESLSRQGRRVAALDVPLSRPTPAVTGVQVVDWGGHDRFFGYQTTPPELAARLVENHGTHPHASKCDIERSTADDYRLFMDQLETGIGRKVDWTRELLSRGGWDLFLQVFTEAHCVGHQAWHLHDPSHPSHDADMAAELGDPVRHIYQALDRAVGQIVETAGDAQVLVWSGHGMSFWRGADFLLPEILYRLGVTEPPVGASRPTNGFHRIAAAIRRRLPAKKGPPPIPSIRADAANSLCFPARNGTSVSGIRLNLLGREPSGRLRPGSEADEFCELLATDLLEIVDERTGGPLIERVIRTSDLYEGWCSEQLPDLLVEWADSVPTGSMIVSGGAAAEVRASSAKIGTVAGVNYFGRTGGHRPDGWFVAAGPGIVPGRLAEGLSVLDLAPTMASMLGAEMKGVDGRAVAEFTASGSIPSVAYRHTG